MDIFTKYAISSELALHHDYPRSFADAEAERIVTALKYAPSLKTNIDEWVNKDPISDIYVGRWCVRNVLKIRDHEAALDRPGDLEILQVIYSILMYAADPAIGKAMIYNIRR